MLHPFSCCCVEGLFLIVVAVLSCLQVALMPVMAAHSGTYHCYLTGWIIAARLAEKVFEPLLQVEGAAASNGHSVSTHPSTTEALPAAVHPGKTACTTSTRTALQQAAFAVMSMHAGINSREIAQLLSRVCGLATAVCDSDTSSDGGKLDPLADLIIMPNAEQLRCWLWQPLLAACIE